MLQNVTAQSGVCYICNKRMALSGFYNLLAILDGLSADIPAIHFQQIERAQNRATVAAVASDQVEYGEPAVVADNRLSIDHAGPHRQRRNGFGGAREAVGEIVAIPGHQANGAA